MNIRKNIDYSIMYARINDAMQAELSLMERYFTIGQIVAERPEKGAAIAAAEYIQKNWPDAKGYSPRNVRRMRELYRVYGDCSETITLAKQIGWTRNVVILEAELEPELRMWYMRAVSQFGWSKLELLKMIENAAHTEIVLDIENEICDNNGGQRNYNYLVINSVLIKQNQLVSFVVQQRCRGRPP